MTRTITIFSIGVLLLSARAGAIYLQRQLSLSRGLAQAREVAGGKNGAAALEGLSRDYPQCADIQFLHARQLRLEQRAEKAPAACARPKSSDGHPIKSSVSICWDSRRRISRRPNPC